MKKIQYKDLSKSTNDDGLLYYDYCIVGAGAAGIYLATRLIEFGNRVVIIEAGCKKPTTGAALGFKAIFSKSDYAGATLGRFFGLGGSTNHWGGVLVPHSNGDDRDDSINDVWLRILRVINRYSSTVFENLGYGKSFKFNEIDNKFTANLNRENKKSDFQTSIGLHLPVTKRNLSFLLNGSSSDKSNLTVYTNAVVNNWHLDIKNVDTDSINSLVAVAKNGNKLEISAKRFVVTAGTLESARIFLEIEKCRPFRLDAQRIMPGAIGHYLSDHLSIKIAKVGQSSAKYISKAYGPMFFGRSMVSYRFIESGLSKTDFRGFSHFVFQSENAGIVLVKELLSSIQARRLPIISFGRIMSATSDLLKIAYCRILYNKLYIDSDASINLQLDIEQTQNFHNRIELSNKLDAYGRYIPVIYWEIDKSDRSRIKALSDKVLAAWQRKGIKLQHDLNGSKGNNQRKPYDAYHPVGTSRIGDDAEAVVDFQLRVKGFDNLWTVNTGILPSAGTANPTFSMLCFAQQLSEYFENSND